jgi:deoxyribodipyrimidine photo-lyase
MTTSVVWFKTDLRLQDNETLLKALAQSDQIIPVYCFDDAHYQTTSFGFKKTGNFRTQFLLESIADLDSGLRALGSGLIILKGKPAIEIIKTVLAYNATKVFAKRELAFEEQQTAQLVEKALVEID